MANLYEQFQTDMKEAMKARDSVRVNVLRMAMSAIKTAQSNQVKQAYDAAGGEANLAAAEAAAQAVVLSDVQVQDIVAKEVKRRREAAELERWEAEVAARHEAEAAKRCEYEYHNAAHYEVVEKLRELGIDPNALALYIKDHP